MLKNSDGFDILINGTTARTFRDREEMAIAAARQLSRKDNDPVLVRDRSTGEVFTVNVAAGFSLQVRALNGGWSRMETAFASVRCRYCRTLPPTPKPFQRPNVPVMMKPFIPQHHRNTEHVTT